MSVGTCSLGRTTPGKSQKWDAAAWLRFFDVETASWTEVSIEQALPARADAAYVLREHGLYRASGEAGAELASAARSR